MADPPRHRDIGDDTGTPRWVKLSAIIGGVLVLLVVVMLFTGHGPGRHIPADGALPSVGPSKVGD